MILSSFYGWGLTGNTESTEGKERTRRVDFFICVLSGFISLQSFRGFTVSGYVLVFRYDMRVSQPVVSGIYISLNNCFSRGQRDTEGVSYYRPQWYGFSMIKPVIARIFDVVGTTRPVLSCVEGRSHELCIHEVLQVIDDTTGMGLLRHFVPRNDMA